MSGDQLFHTLLLANVLVALLLMFGMLFFRFAANHTRRSTITLQGIVDEYHAKEKADFNAGYAKAVRDLGNIHGVYFIDGPHGHCYVTGYANVSVAALTLCDMTGCTLADCTVTEVTLKDAIILSDEFKRNTVDQAEPRVLERYKPR
jgi:hypothetical protein